MFARRLELGAGLAAGILGLLIVAFVLVGPVYQTATGGCASSQPGSSCSAEQTGTATLAQVNHGYPPLALLYFSVLAVVLLSLMVSTILHWRSGSLVWRRGLQVSTGLLVVVMLLGFDLWVFSAPSLLLALVAAIAASRYESPQETGL
jgi:hypothetical protein